MNEVKFKANINELRQLTTRVTSLENSIFPEPGEAPEGAILSINEEGLPEYVPSEDVSVGYAALAGNLDSKVYTEDKVPYLFRTSGGSIDIGERERDVVVGGSLVWGQMTSSNNAVNTYNKFGVTFTKGTRGFSFTAVGTFSYTSGDRNCYLFNQQAKDKLIAGHKYLVAQNSKYFCAYVYGTGGATVSGNRVGVSNQGGAVINCTASGDLMISLHAGSNIPNDTVINETIYIQFFDLTQMFGSAIADYIYSLEQATTGAGVAWFRKYFPKSYYPYSANEMKSVKTSAHRMVGFNAYHDGEAVLLGGMQYQITGTYSALAYEDINGDVETITPDGNGKFTPTNNGTLTVTGGGDDTCVHLVWDGERDGEYEPYQVNTYPLDDIELRGIPKLDANNRLYYDGDTYEADGTVTRRYALVDMSTLTWQYNKNNQGAFSTESLKSVIANYYVLSAKYVTNTETSRPASMGDKEIAVNKLIPSSSGYFSVGEIVVKDSAYTDAEAFTESLEGVYLLYPLLTPTTESATPYADPQVVDDFGTEEYVDTRDVPIPVGHTTQYLLNVLAKVEMAPNSPDGDGDYIVRQDNGTNTYVTIASNETIQDLVTKLPDPPSEAGTYQLQVTVTSSATTYAWVAAT